jgi:signal peptidase I
VGLPGQTLEIKNRVVYLDGKPNKEPDNVQYTYWVKPQSAQFPEDLIEELGITNEEIGILRATGYMPMTQRTVAELSKRKDIVESLEVNTEADEWDIYPLNGNKHWTRDNYGPVWIPNKGETLMLNLDILPIYERCIRAYEGNKLEVKNGKIYINDKLTDRYTFKMDYYWMMGDNRHNSADSRYWGFVPEDHIVCKPIFIWWSSDPDRGGFSGIRWSRLFRFVDNIK